MGQTVRRTILIFAGVGILHGCGGGSDGETWTGTRTCNGSTTTQAVIPGVTTEASVPVARTATGLRLGRIDIGPIAGFSCFVDGTTVTFNQQVTTGYFFDIGFLCAMPNGDTVGVGGFGTFGTVVPSMGLAFINLLAPIEFAGETLGRLSCSENVRPQ